MADASAETMQVSTATEVTDALTIAVHEFFTANPRHDASGVSLGKTYYDAARDEMMGVVAVMIHWETPSGSEGQYPEPFLLPASEIKKLAENGPWEWRKDFAAFSDTLETQKKDAVARAAAALELGVSPDTIIVAPPAAEFRKRKGAANGP